MSNDVRERRKWNVSLAAWMDDLSAADGSAQTALGEMMAFLGVDSLPARSRMIRPTDKGKPVSPSRVQVYRELVEWAILFAILKKDFGTDTLIVCDGVLRSKVFAKDLFQGMKSGDPSLASIGDVRISLGQRHPTTD